jgi:glycosyltransferase involved in cell wall biosynthesis
MFTATLGYGGAESAFLRLATYLSRHMEVTIALMARDYGSGGYTIAQPQTDLPIVMLDDCPPSGYGVLSKLSRWARMWRRLRALKREHDVTISFMSGPNLLNSLAGRSVSTILSERGSKRFNTGISLRKRVIWTALLDPIAYRGAHFIVAASEGLAREIGSANPAIDARVGAIEGTVLTSRLMDMADAPCEAEFDAFRAFPTAVSFGRMDHAKGFDALLKTFARVKMKCAEARLLLIGDGPKTAEYIALAQSLGLRAGAEIAPDRLDVVFAGYRADPLRYLKLGRVFAMTSRYEGLPNALIEALATGIPILAADCPWGSRSILAGPGDENALRTGSLPLALEHGTLMPVPDMPEASSVWEAALTAALVQQPQRRSPESCHAAIARFDIEATGPRWVELIRASAHHTSSRGAQG